MKALTIGVDGMSCEGCETRLAAALRRVEGVGEVSADHKEGTVRVLFEPARTDEDQLREHIVVCGYNPLPSGGVR